MSLIPVLNIFKFLFGFWNTLSDEQKKVIIDKMIQIFEPLLRQYFKQNTQNNQKGKN